MTMIHAARQEETPALPECCRMDDFVRWCKCNPNAEEHLASFHRSCVHHPQHESTPAG